MAEKTQERKKVAIIGSGLIGQNWSMIFAGAGYHACLYDVDSGQLNRAVTGIRTTLAGYEQCGNLRGTGTAAEQADKITGTSSLKECLEGAFYVQECVPEVLKLKQEVFRQIDDIIGDETIVASSSSCLCISMIAEGLKHKHNMLVAHPINPPYFVPLVEIVPAPFTKPEVASQARSLLEEVGQSAITLKKECLGFALNRVQYACINECWNMYKTGLLNAEDIDKILTDGLGLRYALIGPLETMHLNANGIKDYCEKYAEGAMNVQKATFAQLPVLYDTETAQQIQDELKAALPLDKLAERRLWRDDMLARLAKLKKESASKDSEGGK